MAKINIETNKPFLCFLDITSSQVGISGENPVVSLQRVRDSKYWDNATLSWIYQTSPILNTMSEVDSTNEPGLYTYDTSADLSTSEETIIVHYKNTGTYALDSYDILEVYYNFERNISISWGSPLSTTPSGDSTSVQDMLNYLYQALRNKATSTDTLATIANSSGSVISKAVITKTTGLVTREKFTNP